MPSTDPKSAAPRRPGLIRRTIGRHWGGMIALWVVGTLALGAGAYYLLDLKPAYRALSLLRVDPQVTDLYNLKGGVNEDLGPFIQTQVQLITSPNVLTAAGTSPKVAALRSIQDAPDVIQQIRKQLTVMVRPGTYLIEVSALSSTGYEAATIVNAVVDNFIEANSEWSDGMTRQQIKNLEQYNNDLRNQSDELDRKWKKLAARGDLDLNVPGPDGNRAAITIEEFRLVRQEMFKLKLELAQAQAWLNSAQAALAKAGADPAPAEERAMMERQVVRRFAMDPEVIAIREEIKQAEARVSEATRLATQPDDPTVSIARLKLDELTARFKPLSETKMPAIRAQVANGAQGFDPEQEVREATHNVDKLKVKQAAMQELASQLDVKNKTQATDTVEIALIKDERATLKSMQEAVVRRLEQLRYEAKGEARIRPVNPNGARVPNKPISDPRPIFIAIPVLMLLASFTLFFAVEAFSPAKLAGGKDEPRAEV